MAGTWRKRDSRTREGYALRVAGARRRREGGSVRRVRKVDAIVVWIAVVRVFDVDVGARGRRGRVLLGEGKTRGAGAGYMRV